MYRAKTQSRQRVLSTEVTIEHEDGNWSALSELGSATCRWTCRVTHSTMLPCNSQRTHSCSWQVLIRSFLPKRALLETKEEGTRIL